jgi:BioD-like phosphotransacetylase family protein
MKTLFVSSVSDAAGKNMLIAGLGQKLITDKYKIGFLKPLANKPLRHERTLTDEDVLFFHKLFNLEEHISNLSSVVVSDELYKEIISGKTRIDLADKISHTLKKFSKDKDVLLVKGLGRFYRGSGFGLSELNLIKDCNWQTVLIDGYRAGRFSLPLDLIDGFIMAKKVLGNLLIGIVFNYVPEHQIDYLKDKILPFLKNEHKIDVLGIIPTSAKLRAVSIKEIKDVLQGELLCGSDKQENIIEDLCLSTMNMENDLRLFNQAKCNAVIVSGDRVEIQLAALETRTECLILTGKLYPPDIVLSKAEENNIPVMVIRDTSLQTQEKIERLRKHFGLYTLSKIEQGMKIIQKNVNIKSLYKKLELQSI